LTPGFVGQFREALQQLSPALFLQPQLHVLTSAGGWNVRGCAEESARMLSRHGCAALPVAALYGDNLMDRLEELILAGCSLDERDTGERFCDLTVPPMFATTWLGAADIVSALEEGARLVIAGSVSLPVLTTAAAVHAHHWGGAVFDRVATAAAAGQCFQVGSASARSVRLLDDGHVLHAGPATLLAEIDAQGTAQISTVGGNGVRLTTEAILSDLRQPLKTPDVVVNASGAVVEAFGDKSGAVRISNFRGHPPDDSYEVTLGLIDGYEVTSLVLSQVDLDHANLVDVLEQRVARHGIRCHHITCQPLSGSALAVRGWFTDQRAAEVFAREVSWLTAAVCSENSFRELTVPRVNPCIRLWRTAVPKSLIETRVDCRPAREWV
jgi:hypothetical protein